MCGHDNLFLSLMTLDRPHDPNPLNAAITHDTTHARRNAKKSDIIFEGQTEGEGTTDTHPAGLITSVGDKNLTFLVSYNDCLMNLCRVALTGGEVTVRKKDIQVSEKRLSVIGHRGRFLFTQTAKKVARSVV